MKYMLLIHQGTTPTPYDQEAWGRLSEEEQQAIFNDYRAVSQAPGVTPGQQMQGPDTATTALTRTPTRPWTARSSRLNVF